MMKLYMKCTTDKYELPIAVADSTKELAQMLHLANSSVKSAVSREKCGFHKVEIEPEMYPDNDGNLWYLKMERLCMYMDDFDVFNYECEGQMSITDYTYSLSRDRYGRIYEAPEWMDRERCENCKYWEMLPVEEQPPAGWGVKGQCNCTHEPEMMKNGYWVVNKTSYCNDFIGK